jgi:hypothetical protein
MTDGVAGQAARELATEIIQVLTLAGETVAAAESLTGGLVAAALTDVPGSSNAFRGGVVAYATELKAQVLGVDVGMLKRHGGRRASAPRRDDRGGHHRRGGSRPPGRPSGGHRAHRREPGRRHGRANDGAGRKP